MIRRSTLVFLLIFAVLAGSVYYFQKNESQEDADLVIPTQENPLLLHFKGEIKGISIEHTGSGKTELTKISQSSWQVKSHENGEADVSAIQAGIGQISALRIASSLGSELALKDAGLEPPAFVVKITFDDGSQQKLIVGKETPTGSGYYVKVDDSEVFVVSILDLDPFLKLADEPPIMKTPTPPSEAGSQDLPLLSTPVQ